ncbi:DUF1833 family protein [Haematobacter missouriensis]|uniref:DUF1833 domain-containing protein n=1 Tax=Haematobacter missouriensis TaxID=366616 RepID=A0ABX3ZNQ6_9RHOB|nr:DUF1833 family protein [Haematobacter missouriensis]OWJ70999.1 hypothetical protein CDV53_19835 [Haematobacter missouriensis]
MADRDIPAATRASLEDASSPDALLAFLLVEHPALAEPIRLVCDPLGYIYDGAEWTGIVFGYTILDDAEEAVAVAEVTLPNVDRRIGQALREVSGEARLTLSLLSAADFDLSVVPRVPISTPGVIYHMPGYVLKSVTGDALQIAGQVGLHDYSQEPWPCISATQARLPGLYR